MYFAWAITGKRTRCVGNAVDTGMVRKGHNELETLKDRCYLDAQYIYILYDNITISLREMVRGCGMESNVSGRKPILCCCEHSIDNNTSILQELDTGFRLQLNL